MRRIFWAGAAIWLAVNLLALTGYPAVWIDEILSADAGIHLAQGRGFVSAAWFNQPSWEFWASYPPLYAFCLAGWLKVFGISAFAVRAFGLTAITGSLALIGLFLRRLNQPSTWILAALAFSEPLAFLTRAGRPDSVSVLLLAVTMLIFLVPDSHWRSAGLVATGFLAPAAAIQFVACALLLGLLIQIWWRILRIRDIALWLLGAAAGSGFLAALYGYHHVLRIFIESTLVSKHSSVGRLLQQVFLKKDLSVFDLSDIVTAPFRDYATPVLLLSAVCLWLLARRSRAQRSAQFSSFAIAAAIILPISIQLLGKYPVYYCYMGLIPAALACGAAAHLLPGRATRIGTMVVMIVLFVCGVGKMWLRAFTDGSQNIAASTLEQISAGDSVIADYPAYYQLLGHTRELFAVGYAGGKVLPVIPAEQARQINKLLIRDSMFTDIRQKAGGNWQRVGSVQILRQRVFRDPVVSSKAIIDDDTRHRDIEPLGFYLRVVP